MKKPIFVDYPESHFPAFSFLLGVSSQEITSFLNQSFTPLAEKSEEDFQIKDLLEKAAFLPTSEIKKIQRDSYLSDFRLILSSDLPQSRPRGRFDIEEPLVYLRHSSKRPILFSEVPSGYTPWREIQPFPLETLSKNNGKQNGKRIKEVREFLTQFIRTAKEVATPKQWKIARRFFINEYYQAGRVSLKDMAEELGIPSSTFIQQLWGRPRDGKWIGGLFHKAQKRIRRNPRVLALIRKEKRLSDFLLLKNRKNHSKNAEICQGIPRN